MICNQLCKNDIGNKINQERRVVMVVLKIDNCNFDHDHLKIASSMIWIILIEQARDKDEPGSVFQNGYRWTKLLTMYIALTKSFWHKNNLAWVFGLKGFELRSCPVAAVFCCSQRVGYGCDLADRVLPPSLPPNPPPAALMHAASFSFQLFFRFISRIIWFRNASGKCANSAGCGNKRTR